MKGKVIGVRKEGRKRLGKTRKRERRGRKETDGEGR